MLLEAVEDRLTGLEGIDAVASALALTAVLERPPQRGVEAWVVPLSERPQGQTRLVGPALQQVQITFGVVLAVRSLGDPRGNKGSARLEHARARVREALFGWQPPQAQHPCLLGPSDLVRMDKATLWWMDRYITAEQRRAQQT